MRPAARPARLLEDDLLPRHHVGGVLERGPEVLGPEVRIALEQLVRAHAARQFAKDVLDGQPGPLEHGLAEHHVLALFDMILPGYGHGRTLSVDRPAFSRSHYT